jgi:hypothetical protein
MFPKAVAQGYNSFSDGIDLPLFHIWEKAGPVLSLAEGMRVIPFSSILSHKGIGGRQQKVWLIKPELGERLLSSVIAASRADTYSHSMVPGGLLVMS